MARVALPNVTFYDSLPPVQQCNIFGEVCIQTEETGKPYSMCEGLPMILRIQPSDLTTKVPSFRQCLLSSNFKQSSATSRCVRFMQTPYTPSNHRVHLTPNYVEHEHSR